MIREQEKTLEQGFKSFLAEIQREAGSLTDEGAALAEFEEHLYSVMEQIRQTIKESSRQTELEALLDEIVPLDYAAEARQILASYSHH